MSKRPINAETSPIQRPGILRGVLAMLLLAGSLNAHAQQEVPEVISPLRVESDHNNVNIVSGKTNLPVPVLSVPAAPNLRFDYVQNAAPYVKGTQWGGAAVQANVTVHTITGTSESFRCPDFDCQSITGTGSVYVPNANVYWRGGSGERYQFDLEHVTTTGNPFSVIYYASSVSYPNGEVITFAYDTVTVPGPPYLQTFYRPNTVTSNLGYFIAITYHSGDLQSGYWGSPAQATLYRSSAPTTPLGRLTYSLDGSTITDLGGRVFTCQGCVNKLGAGLERSAGALQLPGEASPTLQVAELPGFAVVNSVTRDSVQWNYAYTNLRNGNTLNSYLYDRVTVTGPNSYSAIYDIQTHDFRNVIWRITDSIGRATSIDFDDAYRPTRIIQPEGNETSVVYDDLGNVTSRTTQPKPGFGLVSVIETANYPTASCFSSTFDVLCNRPTWYRDGLARQTDFQYNALGQLTEQTDPADVTGVRRRTIITYETSTGLSRRSVVRVCGNVSTCGTPDEIRTEYEYWAAHSCLPSSAGSMRRAAKHSRRTTPMTTRDAC